ncbi:hypothetical protein BaRGS_00036741 [Batillaria attramentaria]|uniref:Secreted protein n=1 Tax=Batillaria attramentaria TaxID=370345 RepID=A0ABD0JB51_9CAEN
MTPLTIGAVLSFRSVLVYSTDHISFLMYECGPSPVGTARWTRSCNAKKRYSPRTANQKRLASRLNDRNRNLFHARVPAPYINNRGGSLVPEHTIFLIENYTPCLANSTSFVP